MLHITHNVHMLIVYNHMSLVRTHHRDHTYLVCYVYMSRRDRGMRSRSPKLMMHRSRSCLVEKLIGVMYII